MINYIKYDNFIKRAACLGVSLNQIQVEQFDTFFNTLVEKNEVMNLTAITEFEEVLTKHFLDSISLGKYIDLTKDYEVLDLGTGAGFPGVPLKIAYPNLEITLFDSLEKRIHFLDEAMTQIGLEDTTSFVHGRAEDFGRNSDFRESYDLVVSRAVADLSVLCEYALPFVKEEGFFVSYKSGSSDDEIKKASHAIEELGGEIDRIETFILPESDIERTLLFIKKIKKTPEKYPRRPGIPTKRPL